MNFKNNYSHISAGGGEAQLSDHSRMIDKFVFFGQFENCIANADAANEVAQNVVLKVCFAGCETTGSWKIE